MAITENPSTSKPILIKAWETVEAFFPRHEPTRGNVLTQIPHMLISIKSQEIKETHANFEEFLSLKPMPIRGNSNRKRFG